MHYPIRGYDQYINKFLLAPQGTCERWRDEGIRLREAETHEERVSIYNEYLRKQQATKKKDADVSDFIREIKEAITYIICQVFAAKIALTYLLFGNRDNH